MKFLISILLPPIALQPVALELQAGTLAFRVHIRSEV